jgi:hypothetical protein
LPSRERARSRENIEDQAGTIDDARRHHLLEVALLPGGKLVIDDDEIGVLARNRVADFLGFAFADETGCVRPVTPAEDSAADLRPGRFGQATQLLEFFPILAARKPNVHQ